MFQASFIYTEMYRSDTVLLVFIKEYMYPSGLKIFPSLPKVPLHTFLFNLPDPEQQPLFSFPHHRFVLPILELIMSPGWCGSVD